MKSSRIQVIITAAALTLAGACVAWLAAPLGFPFELARHFTPHIAVGAALIAAVSYATNRGWQGAAAALTALVLSWAWVAAPFAPVTPRFDRETITVAVFNAAHDPAALARGADWAQAQGVDILMIAEAHGVTADRLRTVFAAWPHSRLSDADSAALGFRWTTRSAVFSRWPVSDTPLAELMADRFSRPVIQLDIAHPDGALQVTGVHPFPPGTPGAVIEQGRMFSAIAEHTPPNGRFIVMGDFNTTVWSPNYAKLPGVRAGDPRFTMTFPALLPIGGMAIDHILIGDGFTPVRAETGPDLSSDHRPVLAEVRWIADGP